MRAYVRQTVVLLALGALLALPAVAGAAGWAGPAQQVSPPASSAFGVGAALATVAKDATLAWAAGSNTIEVATRPAGGTFGFQTLTTSGSVSAPITVAAPDGSAVVAWIEPSGVHVAERPAGGPAALAPDALSAPAAISLTGAATPDGTVVLMWARSGVFEARIRPPGGAFGPVLTIYTATGGEIVSVTPTLGVGPSGDVVFVHGTATDTGSPPNTTRTVIVRATRRSSAGALAGAEVVLTAIATSDSTFMRQRSLDSPVVAVASSGDVLLGLRDVAFSSLRSSAQDASTTYRALVVRRAVASGTWSAPQELASGTYTTSSSGPPSGQFVSGPVLALTGDGLPTAAWSTAEGSASTLRVATAPSPLGTFAGATDVATGSDGLTQVSTPALVAQRDGGMLLVHRSGPLDVARVRPTALATFGDPTTITPAGQAPGARPVIPTPDGDALVAWTHFDAAATKNRVWMAVYDASAPRITDVTVPATAAPGAAVPLHAVAVDAFSTSSLAWAFGDGGDGIGGDASHAFATAGSFTPTVTATDAVGNAASVGRAITVTAAATPTPTPTPGAGAGAGGAPTVRSFAVSPKRFRLATGATALSAAVKAAPRGTTFRWDVSAAGTVRIAVARLLPGRRVGARCVAPSRKNRSRRACTRALTRGTLTRAIAAGKGSLRFSGRLGRKALAPGRHRATITATVTGGTARSAARTATFTIVRR